MFSTKTAQFAWKDLSLIIEGKLITSFTDIEYNEEKNLEEIYGAGDEPQFIGEGNKSYVGNLEMLQNEYEALVEESKKRGGTGPTDLEVTAIVAYIPKGNTATTLTKTIVDRIVGIKFSRGGKKFTQGNTHIKIQLPFRALRVEPQV